MSRRSDGTVRCDRSGRVLENGGVHEAITVTDLDPETGGVIVYHFCRKDGCHRKVLSKRNLADHLESKDTP